jgi:hypothetical protein
MVKSGCSFRPRDSAIAAGCRLDHVLLTIFIAGCALAFVIMGSRRDATQDENSDADHLSESKSFLRRERACGSLLGI